MKHKYSLQQYLYDAYRMGLIDLELDYLHDLETGSVWRFERMALLSEERHRIVNRMEAYECQPQNRSKTTYKNGDHRSSQSVEGE